MSNYIGKKRQQEAADKYGMPTVSEIRGKVSTDAAWALKALVAIFNCQTEEEQQQATTTEWNKIGFSGADAEILTSFAGQHLKGWTLSQNQMALLHKKIGKYAQQLWWIAVAKVSGPEGAAEASAVQGLADMDYCRREREKAQQPDHDNHDAITACMKAHDRLVDDAGDAASVGDDAIFKAFWAALKPAVSQGTYDAIKDDYDQSSDSWRVLPMIASEWVSWL